jgi:carbamoyl-phosphate synthase large subunit
MDAKTLLLLSGGGHTGHNVLATLAGRRSGLRLVASSDTADEPTLFGFDGVYVVPTLASDPSGFERSILGIIAREQPDLIIPCRDEDVTWLARFGQRHGSPGLRLLCGSPEIAEMAQDKWLSHEFCRNHDLPFAPTLVCGSTEGGVGRVDEFVRSYGLPLVLKPRREAEGRGIRLITDVAQARRAAARQDHVLQQYLGPRDAIDRYLNDVLQDGIPLFHSFEGLKRSLQILIDPNGDLAAVYCTRQALTGRNARTVTPDPDAKARGIAELCAKVLAAAGWRGPMNIQCQPDASGRLMIHEFNARFTGATAARRLLGHDEVGVALNTFIDVKLDEAACFHNARVARESLVPRAASYDDVQLLADVGNWRHGSR